MHTYTHTFGAGGVSDYKEIKTGGPHQTASNTQMLLWGVVGVCVCVCVYVGGKISIQGTSGKQHGLY